MIVSGQQQQPQKHSDPALRGAGVKPGLIIWRVENFALTRWPDEKHGQFHDGDSYLVLKTEGTQGPFDHHVHFWLGKQTSQDEAGTAALKAVELDDLLGGAPTQYREIQSHESRRFMSYFKGVSYMEGGVRSGFRKVETESRKRLLQVKGRKRPRVFEVTLHCDSLNRGDVFILDNGSKIWIWCGADSNKAERRKSMEIAREMRDNDRAGKSHILIVEDDPMARPQKDNKNDSLSMFYSDLGSFGRIKPAGDKSSDEKIERELMGRTTLHRVSDASGQMRVTEIATGNLRHAMLDQADTFILDQGGTALFVWVGKGSTKEEKLQGMKVAVNFLRSKKYPDYTQVTMVKQDMELSLFKQCFVDWPHGSIMNFQNKTYSAGRGIANVQQTKFDVTAMYQQQKRQEEKMFDDGNGKIDIWRVENFKLIQLSREMVGTFFGGDCYVILYTYLKDRKEIYIIYYWLGLNSSVDEQGTAAAMTVKMDDSLGGAPIQIRVVQGKEPEHFLKIFKGKMIVYRGGKASGFKGHQTEVQQTGVPRFFQIRGMGPDNVKALEVEPVAASLNSNDVFVLVTPRQGFLWYGKGCSGDERELAKELAMRIAPRFADDFEKILESQETKGFWELLGGKGEYASGHYFEQKLPEYPARLFLCSNASGRFEVEEIFNFRQSDMEDDDIMLLDTHDNIFLWIGKDANANEKKEAMKTAMEYVKTDPSGRDPDKVQIMVVKQGFEPPQMTGCFPAWDDDVFAYGKSYEQIKRELDEENAGITFVQEEFSKFSFDRKYPLAVLCQEEVPEGVDPTRKEYYLSPEEFQEAFQMTLSEYEAVPQWRKDNLKKQMLLF